MRYLMFLILFFCSSSFASVYEWRLNSRSDLGPFSSASVACDDALQRSPHVSVSIVRVTDVEYNCNARTVNGGTIRIDSTTRSGTMCPSGKIFNIITGSCDADCSATQGTMTTHLYSGNTRLAPDSPWPTDAPEAPRTICKDSCRYADDTSQATVTCGPIRDGDPLQQFCIGMYIGNGEQCQGGDIPQQSSGDIGGPTEVLPENPDDPTDPANNCGPTHVWSGSTCVPIFTPDPTDPADPTTPGDGSGGGGGGGSGDGSGGGGDGGGDGDGSGGGGDGSGGGSGSGGGCGAGSCPTDGGDDGEGHDWYLPGELTMEGVLGDFNDRMAKAPFMTASKQFFTVNVSGSCPVWTAQAWVFSVVLDQHCSTQMPWDLIKAVLLGLASFVAFRWAFL